MATARSFNGMLNDYLAYDLLMEEVEQRNYFIQKVSKDTTWRGGPLIVPFRGNSATSFTFGKLTAEADIHEFDYVRG